jgi:chemotaxis methyl-accepting protein methylase
MKDREFRWFAELVREHTGISFGIETRFLLERRVARRMRELSIDSVSPISSSCATNRGATASSRR